MINHSAGRTQAMGTRDITVYRTDGTKQEHKNVPEDQSLPLENLAFTDPGVSSTKSVPSPKTT
jgi:hypothetical protein